MISSYLSPPSDAIVAARNIWLAWQSELKIHRQLRWKSWKVFPQHEFSPSKGSFLEGKWDPLFQEIWLGEIFFFGQIVVVRVYNQQFQGGILL